MKRSIKGPLFSLGSILIVSLLFLTLLVFPRVSSRSATGPAPEPLRDGDLNQVFPATEVFTPANASFTINYPPTWHIFTNPETPPEFEFGAIRDTVIFSPEAILSDTSPQITLISFSQINLPDIDLILSCNHPTLTCNQQTFNRRAYISLNFPAFTPDNQLLYGAKENGTYYLINLANLPQTDPLPRQLDLILATLQLTP